MNMENISNIKRIRVMSKRNEKEKCKHEKKYVEYMPEDYPHYAMVRCAGCDCYIRWLPFPKHVNVPLQIKQERLRIVIKGKF